MLVNYYIYVIVRQQDLKLRLKMVFSSNFKIMNNIEFT